MTTPPVQGTPKLLVRFAGGTVLVRFAYALGLLKVWYCHGAVLLKKDVYRDGKKRKGDKIGMGYMKHG